MIKQFTNQQGKQFVFVEVPEDASDFSLKNGYVWFNSNAFNDIIAYTLSEIRKEKIIGLAKDLTEEQCKEIVNYPTHINDESIIWWYVFLIDLLESLGFKPNANVLILEVTL